MIINENGFNNNNGFLNNNFIKNDNPKQQKTNQKNNLGFKENMSTYKYTNPANEVDMYDKSVAMLHERYEHGLISIEEFQKKCREIGRKKDAYLNKNKQW